MKVEREREGEIEREEKEVERTTRLSATRGMS